MGDATGEQWRSGAAFDRARGEAEPPLAKWGESSRPKTPDMDRFRRLDMRGRAELIVRHWCTEGYGAAASVGLFYVFKTLAYAAGGWYACAAPYPGDADGAGLLAWADDAYRRFILWTILWEVLGLGCSAGPLNGRYLPSPVVAPAYFLRRGAVKLPPALSSALLPPSVHGGLERGWADIGLYLALVGALVWGVAAPAGALGSGLFLVVLLLHVAVGVRDITVFWAARSDHFLWLVAVLAAGTGDGHVTVLQLVQLAVWFFAGFSKIGPWFPYVLMAMVSNSSTVQSRWLRSLTVRSIARADFRPSAAVELLAHAGTAAEMTFPVVLAFGAGPMLSAAGVVYPLTPAHVALAFCTFFHCFICCHIPMGAPLEWNVFCVASAWYLFGLYGGVPLAAVQSLSVLHKVIALLLLGVPLAGNLFPNHISFLAGMRYYAGNWPNTQWIWKKSAEHKWQRLFKDRALCKLMHEQVGSFYKSDVVMCVEWKQYAFRAMNLHGHLLPTLLRRILRGRDMDEWRYADGEVLAGIILGWNFGVSELHDKRMLELVQMYCHFDEDELYHIEIGAIPVGGDALPWEVRDAATPWTTCWKGAAALRQLKDSQPY